MKKFVFLFALLLFTTVILLRAALLREPLYLLTPRQRPPLLKYLPSKMKNFSSR